MFESPSRVLFDRDPAIAQAIQGELARERRSIELIASENHRAHRLREFHQSGRARGSGQRAHQQVCRRLPRASLLRRMRAGRRGGGPGPHRLREFHQSGRARGSGQRAHQQVCRRLPRASLLRRMRAGRRGGGPGPRARLQAVRVQACQCAAPLRCKRQSGCLRCPCEAMPMCSPTAVQTPIWLPTLPL